MKTNYTTHIIVGVISLLAGFGLSHLIMMPIMHSNIDSMDHAGMGHGEMNHDPMQMSMADMGAMLEGKTGDDLDKAFLEGMIPHHQGAIDMAEFLVDAKHPELKKMGEEIITAQQAEIDQMNKWLVEWNYKN